MKCQCVWGLSFVSTKKHFIADVCTGLSYMIMNTGEALETTMDLKGEGL